MGMIDPPLVPDVELIAEMSGHSGCLVHLFRSGNDHFVRKSSTTRDYNPRLDRQRVKQQQLAGIVPVPRVLSWGDQDGLSFFDMEYVKGYDFKSYVPSQSVALICELGQRIVAPLRTLAGTASGTVDPALFEQKAATVCDTVRRGAFFPDHRAVLDPVLRFLEASDWSGIPASACHGDFTLENLVISDSRVVLIDVLDGDLDSFWLDAAKLLQDLESGWSLRALLWKGSTSSSERLVGMLSRYLYDEISEQIAAAFPDLSPKLQQLRALQAARVLPYVRDHHIFWHVAQGLDLLFQRR
jgi:hypothetical protein